MSVHRSLRVGSLMGRQRSVLTRFERLKILEGQGRWSEGGSVFGLPKVKVAKVRLAKKAKKKDDEEGEEAKT